MTKYLFCFFLKKILTNVQFQTIHALAQVIKKTHHAGQHASTIMAVTNVNVRKVTISWKKGYASVGYSSYRVPC